MPRHTAMKLPARREPGHAAAPASQTPAVTAPENAVLSLQRVIGNRATLSALGSSSPRLQRMPTRTKVVGILGKPHMNILWAKQSTKYKQMLDLLDTFHQHTQNTPAGSTQTEVMGKMTRVMELYNDVIAACEGYQGETGDKADYFLRLKVQVQNEKTSAIGALASYAARVSNLSVFVRGQNKLSSVLTATGPDALDLDDNTFQRNVGGGINQLGVFQHGGKQQYFKGNRNDASGPSPELEGELIAAAESGNVAEQQRLFKEQMAMVTLNDVATTAGISTTDARLANRDVAMYRLDQLLGANLIARTQFAIRNTATGPQLGSLMVGAQGMKAGDMVQNNQFAKDSTDKQNRGGDTVNVQDPNLQRLLSRLQLLDTLAFQVDRNLGNFYVQYDGQGNVTGITGIDNDMSFGDKTGIRTRAQELPGLARYVDREMAERIIGLDPALVAIILSDVLNPAEIGALSVRLLALRQALIQMRGANQLLDPNQWDQVMAQNQKDDIEPGIKQDRTTYYGQVAKDVN